LVATALNVLLVEDSEVDADLVLFELRRRGFAPKPTRVDSLPGLEAALSQGTWDLVLSDHSMPGFSGTEALRCVKQRAPDIPFIVVSGSIGEEYAVEAMRAGASDFIVKNQLHRLAPAVERELREALHRVEQRRTAAALTESQQQLRQAQKLEAIGRLAGGVAHDFNNLLTVVLGFADLVLADLAEDHHHRRDLQEIRDAGTRAVDLTRQLLAFSRQQVFNQTVLKLGVVVEEMARLLRRLVGSHISVLTTADPHLWAVKLDRSCIDQVIMNLVVNARDAMPDGGTLTIETSNVMVERADQPQRPAEPGPYVMLRVRDTGSGIPTDVLPHIFEPFFTTKDVGRGTGLGLSTVYGVVQQSEGCIFVETELNSGTTFTLYFPQTSETAPIEQPVIEPTTPRGNETVLLVDDEAGVRELLTKVLKQNGYHVIAADGPQAAIRAMSKREPQSVDVLLTDVLMPEMTGPQLAEKLRQRCPTLRVIFMSGFTAADVDGLDHVDVLAKPFTPAGLINRLRATLSTPCS
jgi:two-component system, cell cycle sensor histidine kinase and response regulator CckA